MARKRVPLIVPDTLASLLSAFEVHCVACCCGARAFDLAPEHAIAWAQRAGTDGTRQARLELVPILTFLRGNDHKVECDLVYDVWTAAEALAWFERVSELLDIATRHANQVA